MRRVFPLLLLLALGCQPSGCSRPAPPADAPTVTDGLGRSVRVPKAPERVVSLSPAATEILFAIGAGPKVVAGTEFDNFPEEAKALPKVGGFTPQSINVEAVLAHRPDLVVAGPQNEVIAALEKFDIPVIAFGPKGVGAVADDIELLGRVTGREGKAAEVAADFRRRWEAERRQPAGSRPKVLFVLADEPLITCGSGTFIDEIITAAGGQNVFADAGGEWPKVSDEQVLARGCDVILCVEHVGGDAGGVPARLKARPGWDRLAAVKTGRVHVIDADLITRPGPRLVDGLAAVEKALRE